MFTSWWHTLMQKKENCDTAHAWLEVMITLSLHGMNHDIHTIWYLDKECSFDTGIESSIILHAPLCPALAHFIIAYARADVAHTLWLRNGVLCGVEPIARSVSHSVADTLQIHHVCTRYHAVVVQAIPHTRSFTLITEKRTWSELSSHHALALLKQLMI